MTEINEKLQLKIDAVKQLLEQIEADYSPAVLATSYGAEDMVLMDLIAKFAPQIGIFTLDTGRLPKETYDLMQQAKKHYQLEVEVYYPDTLSIEQFVTHNGPNAFYDSVDLRKQCCGIRKVAPLNRALAGKKAWLTGMRRSQSVTRNELPVSEWDADHELQKFSPLTDWSNGEVWKYIRAFDVPFNELHNQGYASIGCAPCTRAITPGEDIRAGRWWWENPETKECGLHVKAK
ncbi:MULTISPECIES: phosphoadenylyl-sulfate reductase [unclassified Methylophaga]|jgi:phosphoadenosine phosphosulfate reductase|uniref:phosphoadenylyl-sulfate reductase n=1 Tax=unclassified Methylophaga TaxID=2629249 RepID=UPI000C6323A4|nr:MULTISPECIES: phosphoadenylyl-sulfate reductase [unclassified Methylophaga]MAL49592.1 phosphoadenylyl-sulfate reductase [Methylophaga sp.]MBP26419.1 phosphoadenylyl-sulfate reductase [Methylophaga sp.]MDX1749707.1 phosphoadenylyl-sulfate reductase [Methylophaga sp.]HCC81875.1 phosphoadenylyl-sulfate reductase [Methylophaga sp.]|tara:strand:+ start:3169 stop:3867 length:699 start_codon:yes stop_codon:yes gene_type:complete